MPINIPKSRWSSGQHCQMSYCTIAIAYFTRQSTRLVEYHSSFLYSSTAIQDALAALEDYLLSECTLHGLIEYIG